MQGQIINGYTLQYLVGKGGMAEVWLAENRIHKKAAVKILNQALSQNQQIVSRFENEAAIMVQLEHPNIRQVLDYATIQNRPCIIMEYLEGSDLSSMMKAGVHFTNEQLVRWWDQLVSALGYTHAQGIVHRDIKPSNIFIDKNGNVKLLDFGIAKVRDSFSMTQTGAIMGTLIYMSPEQVEDSKHIDYKTDIYSLAVSFVHLLSGFPPYNTDTTSDYQIRKHIVEIPLDLNQVPYEWQRFLQPYLAKNPAERAELRTFSAMPVDEGTCIQNPAPPKQTPLPTPPPISTTPPNPAIETFPTAGAKPNPSPAPHRKKKRVWLIILLCLPLFFFVLLVIIGTFIPSPPNSTTVEKETVTEETIVPETEPAPQKTQGAKKRKMAPATKAEVYETSEGGEAEIIEASADAAVITINAVSEASKGRGK
ncbi:MAG: serine/threonine protein kinase [Bacteroidales bacterium]|nr:serine/threonine protein kinase [Bacteroidales bacterium]